MARLDSGILYQPADPPQNSAEMQRFLRDEFAKIAAAISAQATGHYDLATRAPDKPRDGDFRIADGVNWNPGSGAGPYCYYNAAWHFLA